MDTLDSSSLQVVLEIQEGTGFSFLSSPLIVVAALNGTKLESCEIKPATSPQFDTQLLWQTDRKYLRRLRTGNTALKIECYSISNEHKRDRVGYILLNLKEAQIIPRNSGIAALQTWHKLLGLRSEAKSHTPELLLRFKIEEANQDNEPAKVDYTRTAHQSSYSCKDTPSATNGRHFLQIGPPESTDLYELVINIQEAGNLYSLIPPSEIGSPITFQYSLMGSSFVSEDFNGLQDLLTNAMSVIELKSHSAFLASYFKGFPNLTFKLYCGDKIMGSASMDLHELSKFSNSKPFVKKTKLFIKTLEGKDITESESLSPYLKVEFSLLPKNIDLFEDNVKKMFEATKLDAGEEAIAKSTIQSAAQHPIPLTNSQTTIHMEEPEHDIVSEDLVTNENGFIFNKDCSKLGLNTGDCKARDSPTRMTDKPNLRPMSSSKATLAAPLSEQLNSNYRAVDILPRQYIREAAQKTCEELEDWKEQQQEMFKFELKTKAEKHLKKLSDEWIKQKKDLECALKEKTANCQNLYKKLEEAISDLVVRSERLSLREEEMYRAKEELDRKYTLKFQELRKASQLHQHDMEQKVLNITLEKDTLLAKIEKKDQEIAQLRETIAKNSTELSKEQVTSLVEDMRQLEQNFHKALQSKAFFKEQWARALRELHSVKEQQQEGLKWYIKKHQDEVESVELVQGITNEVDEMRRDQMELHRLKEEIRSKVDVPAGSSVSSVLS